MWSSHKENAGKRSRDVLEQLRGIPVPNAGARVVSEETSGVRGGTLVLAVKQKYPRPINYLAGIMGLSRERRFQLDGIGLVLFRMMDGRRNVGDLIDWLMQEHLLTFFEARALFVRYLQVLMEKGVVVMAVKEQVTVP